MNKNYQSTLNTYQTLNNALGPDSFYNFMNHGYFPPYKGLKNYHGIFKHRSSLYLKLIIELDTKEKSILDIGCGRGGGVDLYKQHSQFSRIVGIDISPANINHCKKNIKDIEFFEGNAEELKFKNNTFDYISNVESAHCYNSISKFFHEVKRVLKPQGKFLYTDIFPFSSNTLNTYNSNMVENLLPFTKIIKEDITKNVQKALKKDFFQLRNILPEGSGKNQFLNNVLNNYFLYKNKHQKFIIYTCSDQ